MARVKLGNVRTPIDYLKQYFAPSGHGLGVPSNYEKHPQDIDTVFKSGYYLMTSENGGSSVEILHVLARTESECVQERFSVVSGSIGRRYTTTGSDGWSAWEYTNPPMIPGVEYRTPERWNGKPVYTTLVDFGFTVAGTTTRMLPFGGLPIRFSASANGVVSPYRPNSEEPNNFFEVNVDGIYITVNVGADMVGKQCYVQLWYAVF